jgi:hypothetical protein
MCLKQHIAIFRHCCLLFGVSANTYHQQISNADFIV